MKRNVQSNSASSRQLGRRLRLALKQSPYTLKEACKELDIAEQTMQNYLTGRTVPDALTLRQICQLCKVPMDSLFNDPEVGIRAELKAIRKRLDDLQKGGRYV